MWSVNFQQTFTIFHCISVYLDYGELLYINKGWNFKSSTANQAKYFLKKLSMTNLSVDRLCYVKKGVQCFAHLNDSVKVFEVYDTSDSWKYFGM